MLLGGTPIRLTAAHHDTSTVVIEARYAKHIASVGDSIIRRSLLDIGERE
jgi:hypothetical protein